MIKIQVNLYEHREKDNEIITKLGLDVSANPNALIRDILYKLSLGIIPEQQVEIKSIEKIENKNNVKKMDKDRKVVDDRLLSSMSNLI